MCVCVFLFFIFKVFRYFGYCTLIRYMTCKYFLPLCGRKILIFLIMFFETKRFLILMKCNLLLFSVWLFVLLRNHCLKQGHKGLLLSFLLSFIILVLTFRFLVHVWVKFCLWSEVGIQIHSFAHGNPVFPTLCVEKTILYLLSWHSVKNQLTINICVCFWTLNSTPLIYVSILRPVSHTVLITQEMWVFLFSQCSIGKTQPVKFYRYIYAKRFISKNWLIWLCGLASQVWNPQDRVPGGAS